MKICVKCVLPETFPGISFDEHGVCNFCNEYDTTRKDGKMHFQDEDELRQCLEKYRNINKNYDVLVPLSGGVDSSYTLVKLVSEYNLRPLVYHNDNGYEPEAAMNNVKKLCKTLGVDLIIIQPGEAFMKKLWKYAFESKAYGLTSCFVCANILYSSAIEIADHYNVKLVINGYSKGQAEIIKNKEMGINMLKEMHKLTRARNDKEFYDQFVAKFEILSKVITYHSKNDLEAPVNMEKVLVVPFFVFKFNKQDKEMLKNELRKVIDWETAPYSYPAQSTNCRMNWLGTYIDRIKMGYCCYEPEFAEIVRSGDFTREQALKDLLHNPPEGLLETLAGEVGVDLNSFTPLVKKSK